MQSLRRIVLYTFIPLLFSSCVKYYKYTNRFRKITKSNYSFIDTVYVKDYILCNSLRNINKNFFYPKGGEVVPINEDSVLAHFENAFNKLNIFVQFDTVRNNNCDNEFHENVLIRDRKINHKKIIEISKKSKRELVLVPYIYIDNIYENQIYFLSSGVPAGGDLVRNSYLNLGIYVLQNDKIIYFRSAHHFTISSHEDFEEEPKRQTQENWDKLVKMVMSDYIERLK